MQYPAAARRRVAGFTLIELMIVVVIVGILAAVALPSFRQQVIRGNRAAAQAVMMDIANRQEQYFLANRSYMNKTQLEATGFTVDADVARNYNYNVTAPGGTPPTYTITFTPADPGDGQTLTLDSAGNATPAELWDR